MGDLNENSNTYKSKAYEKLDGFVKGSLAYFVHYKSTIADLYDKAPKPDDQNVTSNCKKVEGFLKGSKAYYLQQGKNYAIKFGENTKLNIVNKVGKESILRLDKAHVGHHEFNHINLNPKFSKLTKTFTTSTGKVKVQPYDPHIKLPPGTLTAGTYAGKFCQTVNRINDIILPIAVTVDIIRIGYAATKDFNYNSTRNTVEKSTEVVSVWTTGYAGALVGSTIGSGILPGIGTIIGGILGGVTGGITGTYASKYVSSIGDALQYDIVKTNCENCGREFKARKYLGETDCKNHPTFFESDKDKPL